MKLISDILSPYTGLFLRLALGVVFVYHGYPKVFGEGVALGTAWNPQGMPVVLQILVAWGEFLGGVAFLLGFLTFYASLGIIIIMAGAIITIHGQNGFGMGQSGFEYNFVLICMCLALMGSGAGKFSLKLKR